MKQSDLEAEGRSLVQAAGGSPALRLLGGMAVRVTCPSSGKAPFERACGDLDFAARGSQAAIEGLFRNSGWSADAQFNLYNGAERLIFHKAELKADVFLGDFEMCHRIPLDGRLDADPLALPLAELLLTKLQIVEANGKDLGDAACILLDHSLGAGDGDHIDIQAFIRPCLSDWGLWRTVLGSLGKVQAWSAGNLGDRSLLERITSRCAELEALLRASPKTPRWRARALLGESLKWYKLPEEVDR